jgi:hypothetical protein
MSASHEATLEAIRAIIIEAATDGLIGGERVARGGGYYLSRIRDLLRNVAPSSGSGHACAECVELRARLVNIYHLTLNGGGAASTVKAIRSASGPGAPLPREKPNAS